MKNKFETNTLVFYDAGLRWLTLEKCKYVDGENVELHDGMVITSSGPSILKECRHVTQFVFTAAQALHGYKSEMSKERVLNPDTGDKFNQMVLEFIDIHTEWNDESRDAWKQIYEYKDRLVALKEEYKKMEMSI